ncbi:MAG: class I SAM-dependent methyltransferase [Microcoleaceae cyanobacterium]
MTQTKKDHFTAVSQIYGKYRPRYPLAFFKYLASVAPEHERVWDCGTGSGQAAIPLAEYFQEIVATDISQGQLENAQQHPRVKYLVGNAESVPLEDSSVDLVVSAQAAHWFDTEKYYCEVKRVLKPLGVLAIWCYGMPRVREDIDAYVEKLNGDILDSYWPKRVLEDLTYTNIPFPFDELPKQNFQMEAKWTLEQLLAFFRTWSASERYKQEHSVDPVSLVEADFIRTWGDPQQLRQITWKIYLRHGRPFPND